MQGREGASDDAVEAAETVRARYAAVWDELHLEPELSADDRHAVRARIRRLNELGFAVDEITLEPTGNGENVVRLKVAVANRRFHARELERLTGLVALEGQARLLLNDLHEYQAWLEHEEGRSISEKEAAERWLVNVLEPSLRELVPAIGPGRDPLQAYCDVLEQKWILSELAGKDVGLSAAMDAYLGLGAPAPESDVGGRRLQHRARYRLVDRLGRRSGRGRPIRSRTRSPGDDDPRRLGLWHHRGHDRRDRGEPGHPSARPDQALRRRPGGRRHGLRGRRRRDLRPPRARTAPARPRPSRSSRACAPPTVARSTSSAST